MNDPNEGLGEWSDRAIDLLDAVVDPNGNPDIALFSRGDHLCRINRAGRTGPRLEVISADSLRWLLVQYGTWLEVRKGPKGLAFKSAGTTLLRDICVNLLAAPSFDEAVFPPLDALITSPTFDRSGRLVSRAGYDPDARLWLEPTGELSLPTVPDRPSRKMVDAARRLLADELLCDFPFTGPGDRANALAMILLPIVRQLIAGPTPLTMIQAPAPGSGKSLLAKLVGIPCSGRETALTPEADSAAEMRKAITSALAEASPIIAIDNLNQEVSGGQWAAAITAGQWKDRILGSTKMVTIPVSCCWLATGNSPTFSPELARRTVSVALDAGVERPELRSGFKYPLPGWAIEHRPELLWACLILIQSWIANGRPKGDRTLASFEVWSETLGGILAEARIEGFLDRKPTAGEAVDAETRRWRGLVDVWIEVDGGQPRPAVGVYRLITGQRWVGTLGPLWAEVLRGGGEMEQVARLVEALDVMVRSGRIIRNRKLLRHDEGLPVLRGKYSLLRAQPQPQPQPHAKPDPTPRPDDDDDPNDLVDVADLLGQLSDD